MGDYSHDLSGLLDAQSVSGGAAAGLVKHSTNRKAGNDLNMDDFLALMVAQLQNQSIDDTADTSEMMNQMVQMSVIQAISNISTLVSDSTNLTYAVSLVGKEVTIGQYIGGEIKEFVGKVTGTGTLNGRQVIFLDDNETPFYLTDILAVGRLPETKGDGKTEGDDTTTNTPSGENTNTDTNTDNNTNTNTDNNENTNTNTDTDTDAQTVNARNPYVPDEYGALG